jgi:hypothetical protein
MAYAGKKGLYGVMAEFDTPGEIVSAARAVREAGYTKTDAFSPYPIHEMDAALGIKKTILPVLIFVGGLLGLIGGFAMIYYMLVIDYPINVGGRPHFSLPAWIPIMFECTVLAASFAAVGGMIVLNGLPQPYHPVFNVPRFELASREKFFLLIESSDPKFDRDSAAEFLQHLNAREVFDVEE